MKPAGETSRRARLVVVGHGLCVVCSYFAVHLTAAGCRIIADELEIEAMPDYARLLMGVDRFVQSSWCLVALSFTIALLLDWTILLRLLKRPRDLCARIWSYTIFGLVLLNTTLCVAWFQWFMSRLFSPIGGPG